MNIYEIKTRWPYYAILILSLFAYYQSTNNLDLLTITAVGIILRVGIKKYFTLNKMWVPYMCMAIIFTFILKLSTEDNSMFSRIRNETMTIYYFYICAIINFLRKPNIKKDTQVIVFVFAIFTITIFVTTKNNSQNWAVPFPVLLNMSFALMVLASIRTLPIQKNRVLRRLNWFIMTLVLIHFASHYFVHYMKDAHKYFNKILKSQRIASSDTASISSKDAGWYEKNKAITIARIYSKENPLHLREATFNLYSKRLWDNEYLDNRKSKRKLHSLNIDGEFITRIQNNSASMNDKDIRECEIILSFLSPNVLFTQKNTVWLKTKRPLTDIYANGKIKGFEGKLGYTIYQSSSPITPSENISQNYTFQKIEFLNNEDRDYIRDLSNKIIGDEQTIKKKVKSVHQYLIKNFKYEITPETPPEVHANRPILHFLQTADNNVGIHRSKPAHCQYFSSASVMLLRAQNIPARYTIGYLCQRYNEFGGYWYVNKVDAHAWVEYYDNGWKTFDPTKDLVITEHTKEVLSGYEGAAEFMKFKMNSWFFLLGSGHIAFILDQWWQAFVEILANNLYLIYIFVLLSALALIYFFANRKVKKKKSSILSYQKNKQERVKFLLKQLKKIERKIKKLHIIRTTSTTLAELKNRIELSELPHEDKSQSFLIIDELQNLIYSKPT